MTGDAEEFSYFESVEEGDTRVTDGRTITEADVVNFAGVSGDFNHHHTDDRRMEDSIYGERIAHGMLVLSAATGLLWQNRTPEERDDVIAFYGIDELRFRAPVYVGDRIHVELEVLETERKPDAPGTGTIRYAAEVKNQDGATVISCELRSLVE